MYAITNDGYRAVIEGSQLWPGETLVEVVPDVLLKKIRRDKARADRDRILRSTDWTQMDDAPLSGSEKSAYGVYRQALRDMPGLPEFPDVPWPAPPVLQNGAAEVVKQPGDLIP